MRLVTEGDNISVNCCSQIVDVSVAGIGDTEDDDTFDKEGPALDASRDLAFPITCSFSFRNIKSKAFRYPGHFRCARTHCVHDGVSLSHCGMLEIGSTSTKYSRPKNILG